MTVLLVMSSPWQQVCFLCCNDPAPHRDTDTSSLLLLRSRVLLSTMKRDEVWINMCMCVFCFPLVASRVRWCIFTLLPPTRSLLPCGWESACVSVCEDGVFTLQLSSTDLLSAVQRAFGNIRKSSDCTTIMCSTCAHTLYVSSLYEFYSYLSVNEDVFYQFKGVNGESVNDWNMQWTLVKQQRQTVQRETDVALFYWLNKEGWYWSNCCLHSMGVSLSLVQLSQYPLLGFSP